MRMRRPVKPDELDGTLTREEYHRLRDAAAQMVTPGLEGLAVRAGITPRPPAPVAAPVKKRGRR